MRKLSDLRYEQVKLGNRHYERLAIQLVPRLGAAAGQAESGEVAAGVAAAGEASATHEAVLQPFLFTAFHLGETAAGAPLTCFIVNRLLDDLRAFAGEHTVDQRIHLEAGPANSTEPTRFVIGFRLREKPALQPVPGERCAYIIDICFEFLFLVTSK